MIVKSRWKQNISTIKKFYLKKENTRKTFVKKTANKYFIDLK